MSQWMSAVLELICYGCVTVSIYMSVCKSIVVSHIYQRSLTIPSLTRAWKLHLTSPALSEKATRAQSHEEVPIRTS